MASPKFAIKVKLANTSAVMDTELEPRTDDREKLYPFCMPNTQNNMLQIIDFADGQRENFLFLF